MTDVMFSDFINSNNMRIALLEMKNNEYRDKLLNHGI